MILNPNRDYSATYFDVAFACGSVVRLASCNVRCLDVGAQVQMRFPDGVFTKTVVKITEVE